jgi:hypothetical protein
MKQAGFLLAALLLAQPLWAAPGDLNEDGKTDRADGQVLADYLQGQGLLSETQLRAADVDGDGKVTQRDLDILNHRLGITLSPNSTTKAQQATIGLNSSNSGQVIDQKTGKPMAGVSIEVPDEGIRVTTDSQGRFTLPGPVAPNRILTARAANYAPFSVTTQGNSPFQVRLEQLSAQTMVLDDGLHHLGDNNYGPDSANSGDFRLPAQGSTWRRTFTLTTLPDKDPYVKIGSLIGVDTPDSVQAGQSHLPMQNTFNNSVSAAFRIYVNGTLVKRLTLNGDNIIIPLPRWLLKVGDNELVFVTASNSAYQMAGNGFFLGRPPQFGVDYDDIEFAHVLMVIPSPEEQGFFRPGN